MALQFLPEMHERYFFLADMLTIVMAFYVRRYWPVAVLVSACSLLGYAPFLLSQTPVPLPIVAVAELLAVIATAFVFVKVVAPGRDQGLLRKVGKGAPLSDDNLSRPVVPPPRV